MFGDAENWAAFTPEGLFATSDDPFTLMRRSGLPGLPGSGHLKPRVVRSIAGGPDDTLKLDPVSRRTLWLLWWRGDPYSRSANDNSAADYHRTSYRSADRNGATGTGTRSAANTTGADSGICLRE
jgi:hypothetical protein